MALGVADALLRPAAKTKTFGGRRQARGRQQGPSPEAKPLPGEDALAKWHDALLADSADAELVYLNDERGLRLSTLMRYEIGLHYRRLTIPVRDEAGALVNVRKYDRKARKDKMMNHPGHGSARLFPLDVLGVDGADEPVLLCEGEWDALLAVQEGFTALTGTAGAGSPPTDLTPLRGRSVYVVYDCDDAGRRGARQVAGRLLSVAKEVFLVDLGLADGEDVTDWFVTYDRTDDDLRDVLSNAAAFEAGDEEEDDGDDLLVTLSSVPETRLDWVWPGRIPAGKLTMLEGDPGLGKSMLWGKIVAHLTTGDPLPGDLRDRVPTDVLVVCAEDDLGDTIIPRLRAAAADVTHVHALALLRDDKGHLIPLSIPEDLPRLRRAIKQAKATLVVFDPITAYLSETINSGNDASVRRALTPLAEIAQTSGAAVLMVRHLNKQGDLKALYRGGGSIAFIGAARSGLVVDRHPEDKATIVLAQTKANLARDVPALTYRVESWDLDDAIPVVSWGEELDMEADELLRKVDGRRDSSGRDAVVAFLTDLLADGPVPAKAVRAAATAAGVPWRTIERHKEAAFTRTRVMRGDDGKAREWEWFIPRVRIVRDEDS